MRDRRGAGRVVHLRRDAADASQDPFDPRGARPARHAVDAQLRHRRARGHGGGRVDGGGWSGFEGGCTHRVATDPCVGTCAGRGVVPSMGPTMRPACQEPTTTAAATTNSAAVRRMVSPSARGGAGSVTAPNLTSVAPTGCEPESDAPRPGRRRRRTARNWADRPIRTPLPAVGALRFSRAAAAPRCPGRGPAATARVTDARAEAVAHVVERGVEARGRCAAPSNGSVSCSGVVVLEVGEREAEQRDAVGVRSAASRVAEQHARRGEDRRGVRRSAAAGCASGWRG